MRLPGLDVKRRAGQVLLALVNKITFHYVEDPRNALVEVRRDDRTRTHDQVQHHPPQE